MFWSPIMTLLGSVTGFDDQMSMVYCYLLALQCLFTQPFWLLVVG